MSSGKMCMYINKDLELSVCVPVHNTVTRVLIQGRQEGNSVQQDSVTNDAQRLTLGSLVYLKCM